MKRREFLKTTVGAFAVLPLLSHTSTVFAALDPIREGTLALPASNDVKLGGLPGTMYVNGLKRLTVDPFNTNFVLADVNFNMKRWFTNFSGDISGRFIEVCSSSKCADLPSPSFLEDVIDKITQYQKADGHFGVDVNWWGEIDLVNSTDRTDFMPILWGNGRLLLGLVAAWNTFHKEAVLNAAKKLGDFYINTVVPRFCDPKRFDEYNVQSAGYAAAYVTCVYEGMEGLVQLYRTTREKKYLDCVVTMADFHEKFDALPVGHSHGSLSEHEGLMMIYEETGDPKYLARVEKRWEDAVNGGYVNVCGSILEKFWVTGYDRDEGCTEADWLRVNLMLWRSTGKDKYLDMAERLLYNGYAANQWPNGAFGHRGLGIDDKGPFSYQEYVAESVWCCSFHCPMGLYDLKRYMAVAKEGKLRMNFAAEFTAPVTVNGQAWTITSTAQPDGSYSVHFDGPAGASVPFEVRTPGWASKVTISPDAANVTAGTTLQVRFESELRLEDRRLHALALPAAGAAPVEAALFSGPRALVAMAGDGKKIEDLTLTVENGKIAKPDGLTTFVDLYTNESERMKGHSFLFHVSVK